MVFGLLLDMFGRWCRDQVGKGEGASFFFKGINYDMNLIVVETNCIWGGSKFHGSMLSLTFHLFAMP